MNRAHLLALTMTVLFLIPAASAQDDLFPLNLGDSWVYEAELPTGITVETTRTIERTSNRGSWLLLDSFHGVTCWVDARRNRIYALHEGRVSLVYDLSPTAVSWSISDGRVPERRLANRRLRKKAELEGHA